MRFIHGKDCGGIIKIFLPHKLVTADFEVVGNVLSPAAIEVFRPREEISVVCSTCRKEFQSINDPSVFSFCGCGRAVPITEMYKLPSSYPMCKVCKDRHISDRPSTKNKFDTLTYVIVDTI